MSSEILPARTNALVPRGTRRPTILDRVRVREFAKRLEAGEDEVEAFWAIASSPRSGYVRYRDVATRPPELVLRRKLAALLQRVTPGLVDAAKDVALTRLVGLSDDALRAVEEVVTGHFGDGGHARARLEAARIILSSLGIREQAPQATAQANVVLSFGDAIRAMRNVPVEVTDDGHA